MTNDYHKPAHYAAILRDRATIERTVRGDEGHNGLAANFEAAADMLDIQRVTIVSKDVLIEHFKRQTADLVESLAEASFDEPELRSKLDKQRQSFRSVTEAARDVLRCVTTLDDPTQALESLRQSIDQLDAVSSGQES